MKTEFKQLSPYIAPEAKEVVLMQRASVCATSDEFQSFDIDDYDINEDDIIWDIY